MAYVKQNFKPGDVVSAEQLGKIEDALVNLDRKIKTKTVTINIVSGQRAYSTGLPVDGTDVLSAICLDRFGWSFSWSNGQNNTIGAGFWCIYFIDQPSGSFTFRVTYVDR